MDMIFDLLERNYRLVIGIVLIVVGFITGVNQVYANYKEQVNDYILENVSVENHAWNGIVVAQTAEEDVEKLLSTLDFVNKNSINTVVTRNFTYIHWSWRTSPDNAISFIRLADGFVDRIILSFSDELTVESIIPIFGFPDEVFVSPVVTVPEQQYWAITLHYLEEGIMIEAYSDKLQESFSFSDKLKTIELIKPDEITSAQELAAAYRIDISDLAGVLPAWLPTKDKQLFEAYLSLFRQTDAIPYGPQGIFHTSGIASGNLIADQQVKILRDGTTYDGVGNLIECPLHSHACTFRASLDPNQNNHIFVNGLQAASIGFHAGVIAHEAFHLSLPFDTLQNSQYEEMTAIAIGYAISGGENKGTYFSAPSSDLGDSYSEKDIIAYITAYCGETCSYLELPTYPDRWDEILYTVESENDGNE
jgi:hypothetical protein